MSGPAAEPPSAPAPGELLVAVARVLLGAVFVYLGLTKALEPVEFLKQVREYGMFEQPLALNLVAAGLPWFEVGCGLLLVFGVAVRGTAAVVLGLVLAFSAAIAVRVAALQTENGLPFCAIKFDCGCGSGEVYACRKLAENVALAAIAGALMGMPHRRLCLRAGLFERTGREIRKVRP